jgi:hypothetical protein
VEIIKELETEPLLEYIGNQRQNLRDHVNRMDKRRIAQQILQYALCGRQSIRTSTKKMARDRNRPRGLTCLQDDDEQQNASRDFLEQLWFHSMSS